jgi:hypothetical protein
MKTSLLFAAACLALAPFKLSAATTHYVDAGGTNAVPPFTNWLTAATNIQAAIDVSTNGDTVLVTNGIYRTGGRVVSGVTNAFSGPYLPGTDPTVPGPQTNRVAIMKAIILQSVNGPNWTIIEGVSVAAQRVRCAYLTNGATLTGFTLTNGLAQSGGGAWCLSDNAFLSNCIVVNNQAAEGGGVFSGTVENCILLNNHGVYEGGGALVSTLNNSVLTGNMAGGGGGGSGGGASFCVLNSCTVVSNLASAAGDGVSGGVLNNCVVYDNGGGYSSFGVNYDFYYYPNFNYCCTTPMPTNGVGNITNDPAFVNPTNGDLHLQATSRCINAGINTYVVSGTDLDGSPRIMGGTVDMGAYEFQAQVTGAFSDWLQQYNLPTDGSGDYEDSDGTGMANWQKWIAGLNPTNPASVLAMTSVASTNASSGITVSWQSVSSRTYYLQRASNLATQPAFSAIQSNIVGQAGMTSYTDASATNGVPYFYRVGVQ